MNDAMRDAVLLPHQNVLGMHATTKPLGVGAAYPLTAVDASLSEDN